MSAARKMAHLKPATFVHHEAVARNVAQVSVKATAAFHRQVKAHTFPLIEALDALPPGVKAYILLLESRIVALEETR